MEKEKNYSYETLIPLQVLIQERNCSDENYKKIYYENRSTDDYQTKLQLLNDFLLIRKNMEDKQHTEECTGASGKQPNILF